MINKSIISAITFLLISMFYVAPASAAKTMLSFNVPYSCGLPSKISDDNGNCIYPKEWKKPKNEWLAKNKWGGYILQAYCEGKWDGVAQITTPSCGTVKVAMRFRHYPSPSTLNQVWVTSKNAICVECYDQEVRGRVVDTQQFNINVCPISVWNNHRDSSQTRKSHSIMPKYNNQTNTHRLVAMPNARGTWELCFAPGYHDKVNMNMRAGSQNQRNAFFKAIDDGHAVQYQQIWRDGWNGHGMTSRYIKGPWQTRSYKGQ
jgi:hypothetical protein